MKRFKYLWIFTISLAMASCEKNDEVRKAEYRISDNQTGFEVSYRDEKGEMQKQTVIPASKEDTWKYSFEAREGDILYVSGIYDDISSGIRVQILLDNKLYKERSSLYDTLNFVIVSGTVPFK
ncbi:MAG: hypothetical protein U5Q03_01730 [Bacteroidota bacterium]|nr:hypothetical protein [Bacteroidota bacterium]